MTLSGIFRDLLPQQCRLLAQAALLAASADEPPERNYVRKHALACQAANGVSLEVAALRVFSNAPGAYGSNVNQLIESSRWDDEDELGNAYKTRKCHAYGADGSVSPQIDQLERLMGCVQATYQNLDSVELGVTTIDHYFDTLGGISRAASSAQGRSVPVYIADHTTGGRGQVRSLDEQVALETRTRMLNPRWHESMLEHGYEGVHCIETHLTNTMGWSATTGQVDPWVYRHITQTFVLDDAMRARLAELNPSAGLAVANRLIEACERNYWQADPEMLDALHRASEELEDRLEGVCNGAIA
jgi:magnesium chelatase subunit H